MRNYNLTLARIESEESFKRLVQCDQSRRSVPGWREGFVEREFIPAASPFFGAMGAGVINRMRRMTWAATPKKWARFCQVVVL